MSQCVNVSIGKGYLSRSLRATSCALNYERVHLCTYLHTPLCPVAVTKTCPSKSHSHAVREPSELLETLELWPTPCTVTTRNSPMEGKWIGQESAVRQPFPNIYLTPQPLRAQTLWFGLSQYFCNFPSLENIYEFLHLGK